MRGSLILSVAGAAACGFFEFIFTRVLGMLAGDHAAWGHGRRPFVDMLGAPRPAAELAARTGCPGTVIGLYPTAGDGGDVSSVDAGRMPETGVLTRRVLGGVHNGSRRTAMSWLPGQRRPVRYGLDPDGHWDTDEYSSHTAGDKHP